MATHTSSALNPYVGTAAAMQAYCTFIDATLTLGWVYVPQTGDSNPATIAAPTTTFQQVGFRVYRMADTLQATNPVFIKVTWGSGAATATPGMWLTIGTGADGAGNITGVVQALVYVNTGTSGNNAATVTNCYGSADVNRFSLGMFVQAGINTYISCCTLERSKDVNGNDTSDGVILIHSNNNANGAVAGLRYLVLAGGTQPNVEGGLSYVISVSNPQQTFGAVTGIGVPIPFKGAAVQPGMNMMVLNSSDVAAESQIPVTIYGVSHTYQHLNSLNCNRAVTSTVAQDTAARVLIRYD